MVNRATTPDLRNLTNANLQALIDQTESTLLEMKDELERRNELSQHHEIANLDNHMKSAELSLKTIRDFIAYLAEDRKSRR